MKVYVAHSTQFDFKKDLYSPLKEIENIEFIFPHETDAWLNSKKTIKECDLVIAETTIKSTGLGIELGWANAFNIPIIILSKNKIPNSFKAVSDIYIIYDTISGALSKIKNHIHKSKI